MFHESLTTCFLMLILLALLMLSSISLIRVDAQQQVPASAQNGNDPRLANDTSPLPNSTAQTPAQKNESAEQDDDVVRVDADLTNVLFTAVDKDRRFVTTLRQEDIRVTEDGVPQEVFTFQRETNRPLSLAILIDASASQQATLPLEKRTARQFIETIIRSDKDEVAVISFTGDATLEQNLTSDSALLRRAIDRVKIVLPPRYTSGVSGTPPIAGTNPRSGSTAIWEAIWATAADLLAGTSERTRRAIILLTDGIDTSSRLKRSEAIEQAVKSETVIYTIGIGDEVNYDGVEEGTLRKLSEQTGGRAYFPKSEEDLSRAFTQIEHELRSQHLVAYLPTNKRRDGSFRHVKIEVVNRELRKQKLRLTYRQGYFAKSAAASSTIPQTTRQQ